MFSYDPETKLNIPVDVTVSFIIKDVLKIEEIDHAYSLKVNPQEIILKGQM